MNTMFQRFFIVATLVFLAVVGILYLNSTFNEEDNSTATAPSSMSASLRLKWLYDPGFAGELVAAKAGLFKKHDLTVDIRPGGFDADPIKLVASGADTIGVAGADTFLLARAKGVPIVAFAAGYLQTGVAFYSKGASGINSPRDFEGHKVGYQAGQDTATIYEALIAKLQVDRSKIDEVPVRYDLSPFLNGQVDVWPGYAATQSYILKTKNIPYNVILPADYGLHYLGTVYFARADTLAKHPKLIQAFVDGLIEGWRMTYADYDTAIPMIESYDPQNLTPPLIKWNLHVQKGQILPPGAQYARFTQNQWEQTQSVLLTQGLLDDPVKLNDAVSYAFLNKHYDGN